MVNKRMIWSGEGDLQGVRFELAVSARARRARLRVIPGRGLVVSVPRHFSDKAIAALVARNAGWIAETLAQIEAQTPPAYRQWPPRELSLEALGIQVYLHYGDADSLPVDSATDIHLAVRSSIEDKKAVAQEIAQHLKVLARSRLTPWLAALAHLHGLTYKRVIIRGQRTRWGSYSSSGTLSLNYKLLFLSHDLVNYVLLHELVHTVYPDHSSRFWNMLVRLDVNARMLDKRLGSSGVQIPPWLELAR